MNSTLWMLIAIAVLLILFGSIFLFLKKKEKRKVDYYSIFLVGIIWVVMGIPLKNYFLSSIGVILLIIGLRHRNKWERNKRKWENLENREKKWIIFLMILLSLLILAILAFLIFL